MAKKRGGYPGGGMPSNMNNIMKQAQKMQKDMEDLQANLDTMTFEASSGGGAIKAVVTGKRELVKLNIDKDAVDPEDVEMLEDMIVAAVNEALRQAEEKVSSQMSAMTGGMGGLNGLF